jgi:hypothetical protein
LGRFENFFLIPNNNEKLVGGPLVEIRTTLDTLGQQVFPAGFVSGKLLPDEMGHREHGKGWSGNGKIRLEKSLVDLSGTPFNQHIRRDSM